MNHVTGWVCCNCHVIHSSTCLKHVMNRRKNNNKEEFFEYILKQFDQDMYIYILIYQA